MTVIPQTETYPAGRKPTANQNFKKGVGNPSCGYDRRLVREARGQEQSFEEARAAAHYYTLVSSHVNLLKKETTGTDGSAMDLDDDQSEIDVSMDDDMNQFTNTSVGSSKGEPKANVSQNSSIASRRVLFGNTSFVSTASSTIDERDAIGAPMTKERGNH